MNKQAEKTVSDFSVLVIIAALNEEEGIGPSLTELKGVLNDSEYLVIDGNSVDKTVKIAKEMGAEVLFQEGSGKGNAIAQGIEYVKNDPKYVVFIDADFTYPARYIHNMIEILEEKPSVGMVLGNRFNHIRLRPANIKNIFYIGNRLIAFVHNVLNRVELNDPLTGLRIVRWRILKRWKPKSTGFDIEVELNSHVDRLGYQIVEIPINYRTRLGEKKLKLRDGFDILRRIILENLYTV